ncbi:ankyrin repeat-containing domain protein [Xylariaceae sp. FL1272]|nr:ankyrin repeat-containing domain protein [Xylariaceae sp. FL1272]
MDITARPLPYQEPPVFSLPGVSAPDTSSPPRAYAVYIHGMDGAPHPDLPWPELFDENHRANFTYDVSRAVGASASEESIRHLALSFLAFIRQRVAAEEGSSITYIAYDIGGIVVKQALLTASTSDTYKDILDTSSLIMFYGTPHQPSASTWVASTLRLLNFRFVGLLGPWVSIYVEAMSVYQQHLNDGFRAIASDLRIVNFCQAADSPNCDRLTDAACATIGLDAEDMIILDRSHSQLYMAVGHKQLSYLRETILDAETRNWLPFRKFLSTIRISQQEPSSSVRVAKQLSKDLIFAEKSLQNWQAARSAVARMILPSHMEFNPFCDAFSGHIKSRERQNGNLILRLGRNHPHQLPATRHQLGITYCLIESSPGGPLYELIAEILATTRQSENLFRLLLVTDTDTVTGLKELDTSPLVSPSSRDGTLRIRGETVLGARSLVLSRSTWHSPASTIGTQDDASGENTSRAYPHTGPKFSSSSESIFGSLRQRLSRLVDDKLIWPLHSLAWICFAIRPLSRIEAEQALSVVWDSCVSSEGKHGGVLLDMLEFALPDLLSPTDGVILASPELRQMLDTVWAEYIGDSFATPEDYLARTSFCLAGQWLRIHPLPAAKKVPTSETTAPDSAEDETRALDDPKHAGPSGFSRSYASHAVEEYAMRYWVEHYFRAEQSVDSAEDSFRHWLGTNPGFELDVWIEHLTLANWCPVIEQAPRRRILPSFLKETFGLDFIDACYVSFHLATLPLGPDDDVDWRLLEIASKRLSDDAYFKMILSYRKTVADSDQWASVLQRVMAAASDELRERSVNKLDTSENGELLRTDSVEILLTAIAIGNTAAATMFLGMEGTYAFGRKQENSEASTLGTALQVACEYGDEALVEKILGLGPETKALELELSYPWNALHVACHQGQASLVTTPLKSGGFTHNGQRIAADSPWQFNPLLVTSSRGLSGLSKLLVPLEMKSPADEEGSVSPLHLASSYGFEKTVVSLVEDHGHKPPLNPNDDNPVFLALRSGRDNLARRVYIEFTNTFFDAFDALYASEPARRDPKAVQQDRISLFATAEKIIVKALFTALEGSEMTSSIETIVENLHDWSKLKDSKRRSPVMVAALMGSGDLVKKLYTEGPANSLADDRGWTVLHYAFGLGHIEVAKFFIARDELTGLTMRNNSSETPLIAAAVRGHREIVKLILSSRSDINLQAEFILAVRKGLNDTADLILKAMDPADCRKAVTAKMDDGSTPLHLAAQCGSARTIQLLLLRGADAKAVRKSRAFPTPLAIVSYLSKDLPWPPWDSMRLLLDAGASPDSPIRGDDSVLVMNVFLERVPGVRLLLDYGAIPRISNIWLRYPSLFAFAVIHSSVDVVKVLLGHFDTLRKRAAAERTLPVHIPTPTEALQTILGMATPVFLRAFIDTGGSLDVVTHRGDMQIGSAFMYAAAYGSDAMLRVIWELSKPPVDVNETGGYHGTALQAALVSDYDAVAKTSTLLGWGAAPTVQSASSDGAGGAGGAALHGFWGTALHAAVMATSASIHEQMLHSLLNTPGVSRNQPDGAGRLPLHLAAQLVDGTDSWTLAEQLSDKLSTVTSQDYQGRNALHVACGVGNLSFVQKLLEDQDLTEQLINKTDRDGWTPLHWACRSGQFELVKLLIQQGATTTELSIRPAAWLPYHVAVYHGWAAEAPSELEVDGSGGGQPQLTEPGKKMGGGRCDCCRCVSPEHPQHPPSLQNVCAGPLTPGTEKLLYGVRYACKSEDPICINFALCFKCIMHQFDIHPVDHEFEKSDSYDRL